MNGREGVDVRPLEVGEFYARRINGFFDVVLSEKGNPFKKNMDGGRPLFETLDTWLLTWLRLSAANKSNRKKQRTAGGIYRQRDKKRK